MYICITLLISHGGEQIHTAPPSLYRRTSYTRGLSTRTLNIRDGWGYGLAQAIRAVQIDGFDPMILTEANTTEYDYF